MKTVGENETRREDDRSLFWVGASCQDLGRAGSVGGPAGDLVADVAVAASGAARSGLGAETPCFSQSEGAAVQASRDVSCA